jgi:hypothetical protein
MKCPNGAEIEGHVLLPKDPYSRSRILSDYSCTAAGCDANLSHHEAKRRAAEIEAAFQALATPFRNQEFKEGCRLAKKTEANARAVLALSNHLWTVWGTISGAIGDAGQDPQFACQTFTVSESLAEPHCLAGCRHLHSMQARMRSRSGTVGFGAACGCPEGQ